MRFTITLLASLAVLTQAQTNFPSCIQDCIEDNPTSSFCDGDETGQDLADCTCDSLRGSGLVECMSDCAPEDQTDYASILDGACRDELFPDASDDSNDDSDDTSDDNDDGPSQTDGGDDARETGQSGDDSDDNEDAAAGISASMVLAAGGVVAAFFF